MKKRIVKLDRNTRETKISVKLNIDGTGKSSISTGLPFFDHMLELFSKHSLIDLDLKAKGDIEVDYHHTVEDVGLLLGSALDKALGTRRGIVRYGASSIPMDESLCKVSIDLGGRPYLVYKIDNKSKKILDFDLGLFEEFFRAIVSNTRMNLHIDQAYGKDPHHAYESVFKAVARALRVACERDPRVKGVPSSKGTI